MNTTLEDRVRVKLWIEEQLRRLPVVERLGLAMGIAADLAKETGMTADLFAATAYVSFEHCDGTTEEAMAAAKDAFRAVHAARARRRGG
jgi:hypothetical protein